MDDTYPRDLVRHVAVSTGLPEATATRVIADVAAYFEETVEEFVIRRHGELRNSNEERRDMASDRGRAAGAAGSGPRSCPSASSAAWSYG